MQMATPPRARRPPTLDEGTTYAQATKTVQGQDGDGDVTRSGSRQDTLPRHIAFKMGDGSAQIPRIIDERPPMHRPQCAAGLVTAAHSR